MALLFELPSVLIGYVCKHMTIRLVGDMSLTVNVAQLPDIGHGNACCVNKNILMFMNSLTPVMKLRYI
jgi:hypothetical protein